MPAVVDPTGSIARYMRGDSVGRPDTLMGSWLGATTPTVGQKTMAASIPVAIASDQRLSSTSARTAPAQSLTAVTILAANPLRLGATVYNAPGGGTNNRLRLLLGTGTVSGTVFTVRLEAEGYYEVPFGYTGIISGIWDAGSGGAAQVMEFTA